MRKRALHGVFDGTKNTMNYMQQCRHAVPQIGALLILTRDVGYHSGGWWKNPDYERCWHLSMSFDDGFARDRGDAIARRVFGHDVLLTWIEPPYSAQGKAREVWHYRLFCDPGWAPIKPTGEVYSRRMPAGWRSFSELHDQPSGLIVTP